ncbi:ammonia-dependent NAD(+) synthetase [Pullulanibacillus sp. KACC 23026]|uniref:ammonia-dependent NAD(+) synthetase n=1 Tax=Pullulanibacillus sp. KACC 23026 TaxID=3028315 RepID=UPI0023B16900|nr:ammonia-dependent NAD(+) synthetase [Pullulanibacillus sp. KACC 23026]WEG13733.1 ammonia-dependent NAD(+) synthetase [Pullulanibacillus sp. KACC 23026]
MRERQKEIIEALHVQPTIDPEAEVRKRIDFLKDYCVKAKAKGFVLGLSLGQDSTLAGKLAQLAVDELNEEQGGGYTFLAVRLPHGNQLDEADSELVFNFIQPKDQVIFNIEASTTAFQNTFNEVSDKPLSDFQKGNVKARLRMIAQYAFGGMNNLLVIGTDHAAEAITGFFTKYGDGGADLLPLSGLSKRQGKALLKSLGCPERLYLKKPTADLLEQKPQQADETELGISYDEIDDYLEGKDVTDQVAEALETRYAMTQHKRELPPSIFDNWWKELT